MFELRGKYNSCKVFTDNADEACVSQLLNLLNQESLKGLKIRVMPDCLPDFTEVLTTKGFIKLSDLKYEDLVANYDPDTKQIIFSNPKYIITRPLRDDEIVFEFYCKQSNFSICATEKHRMLLKKGVVKAESIEAITTLSDYVFFADGIKNPLKKYSDLEIQLICWIVGDASLKKNNGNGNYRIAFSLGKERKIKRICTLLDDYKLQYKRSPDRKGNTSIIINTESSDRILKKMNYEKEFPYDFLFLDKNQSNIFVEELIQVDGDYEAYINKRGYRFSSINERSIDIAQAVFCINNNMAIRKERIRKTNFDNEWHKILYLNKINEAAFIHSKSGFNHRKIEKRKMNYNGNVYCIECETSFFVARQNGVTFITGNCHAGAGCVIGTTMEIKDKVIPNLVGVDVGCGMYTVKLKEKRLELPKIDSIIRNEIPSGGTIRTRSGQHRYAKNIEVGSLRCLGKTNCRVSETVAMCSVGTLGGGNHFIEIDKDEDGNLYLVVHTGSRRVGKDIAEYYQNRAYETLSHTGNVYKELEKEARKKFIEDIKKAGKQKELNNLLSEWKYESSELSELSKVPYELAYCEGNLLDDYIHDMKIAQEYAHWNRKAIIDVLLREMKLHPEEEFETIHNYIDMDSMILRKGAISARKDEKVLIPMNMRDGSLICIGKGNLDWNHSAPHGAGRIMSRSQAKENISMSEFIKTMKEAGIYSTSINRGTIDESPFAYKPAQEIMDNIKDTVETVRIIKPIYNFKASDAS